MSVGSVQLFTGVVIIPELLLATKNNILVLVIKSVLFVEFLFGPARVLLKRRVRPHIVFLDVGLKVTHELGRRVLTTVFLKLCVSLGFLFLISLNGPGSSLALLQQVTKACLAFGCRVILAQELGLSRLKRGGWLRLCCRLHDHFYVVSFMDIVVKATSSAPSSATLVSSLLA